MKTYLANPSGYCKGVQRAIALAISFKNNHPNETVYVLGDIVHNEIVVNELSKKGIVALSDKRSNEEKINALPEGAKLIFTAHGHEAKLEELAKKKNIETLDATCPIVEMSFEHIRRALKENKEVIYVGKSGHPETEAALSISNKVHLYDGNVKDTLEDEAPFITNQTTLSIYELEDTFKILKEQYPEANFEDEICRETKLRQHAVLELPYDVDCVFVVGGFNSSNTHKLYEIAKKHFATMRVYKILSAESINAKELAGLKSAAIISGASTPLSTTMEIKVKLDEIW